MTVIDTTGVIDLLLGWRAADDVRRLLDAEKELCAPDVLVFEVLSALRRQVQRGVLPGGRAQAAIADLEDVPIRLHASLPLRFKVWEHRQNLTAGDALFVALAEELGEPLATGDAALVRACSSANAVEAAVIALGS